MKLRDITFRDVWCASGARNFDGRGYPFHRWVPGLDWQRTTFVAKTTPLAPRAGHLPLRADGVTPRELFPRCIKVYPRKGIVLNSVSLSSIGLEALLAKGWWQAWPEPFFLSLMSLGKTIEERLDELSQMVPLIRSCQRDFRSRFGIQLNVSCPNTHVKAREDLVNEVGESLNILGMLDVPLVVKLNAHLTVQDTCAMERNPQLDAVLIGNTIHWDELGSVGIDRQALFGTAVSPLAEFGGGGLSGAPLLAVNLRKIRELRAAGFNKPIVGEGGILCPEDAERMIAAGADAIGLGSIAILRGWRLRKTVEHAEACFRLAHLPIEGKEER